MKTLVLSALALASAACSSVHHATATSTSAVIARHEDAEGTKVSWELFSGGDSQPELQRTEEVRSQVGYVGISCKAVTRELATIARAEPWQGAWLELVAKGSPAWEAGLRKGDIVLRVGDVDVSSGGQLIDWIETHAVPGEGFEVTFLPTSTNRTGEAPRVRTRIDPVGRDVFESFTESYQLASSAGIWRYAGLSLAELPASLAAQVYGEERAAVVVARTLLGSPAYAAGLRAGDRVLRCDGEPVEDLDVVRRAVRGRLEDIGAQAWPPDDGDWRDRVPEREGDLELEVTGPLGTHVASFELSTDLDDDTRIFVPILFEHESDLRRSETSVLDFIFQFGFNYESRELRSSTRERVSCWEFSLFPLGMFEFERRSDGSRRNTFFWFITFEG